MHSLDWQNCCTEGTDGNKNKSCRRKYISICICCLVIEACTCLMCIIPNIAHAAPEGASSISSNSSDEPEILTFVQPIYPKDVLSEGLSGEVRIRVEVDKNGAVISTNFQSGPAVFKESALSAASKLVFSPATLDGVPVSGMKTVLFNFSPPSLPVEDIREIVVHSSSPDHEDTRTRQTLTEEELDRTVGNDLGETISTIAGVRMASGNADASKPIIRGQQERRLLILNSGVRHASQKWGPDHATEIDPFSAGSISVIRGAAGARYGPDAIGGVILIEPPAMRFEQGVGGKARATYNTNGRRVYGAFRLDNGFKNGFSTRIEGNAGVGASLESPTYILGNTASKVWNIGGTLAHKWGSGLFVASWHHHDFQAGVFYGVNHATPTEFLAQLDAEQPTTADLWSISYDIDRPYQDVTHDIGRLQWNAFGDWGSMQAIYAFQINLRKEFERAREDITGPQFDFTLRTHSLDAVYQHPIVYGVSKTLTGEVGIQGTFQENVYQGLSLIPNYRNFSGGIFAYERLALERLDIEVGVRADALSQATYIRDNDYDAHVRRQTLDEETCTKPDEVARCPADYTGTSVSFGTLLHIIPSELDLKMDLSSSIRFPNVDELYMLGSSPSFPVYALGYPSLKKETVWNSSLTLGFRRDWIEAEFAAYGQIVHDYIYFSPELNEDGVPRFDVTIRGTWPRWSYQPIDALFYGMEGQLNIAPESMVGFRAQGDIVRAEERETKSHLVGTPADRLKLTAIARPHIHDVFQNLELGVTTELIASQTRVNPDHDVAPPPEGYILLGGSIDATFGEKNTYRFGLEGRNLLNAVSRDYSSLLRYYADQPGRDIRIRVGANF